MNEFVFTYDLDKTYFEKLSKEFERCNPTELKWSYKVIEKKNRVMFNGPATILEIGDFKTIIKCHEEDEFDFIIGLGLALGRYYEKQPSTKKDFKYLKKNLNDWEFSRYCLSKYFDYDNKRILKFLDGIEKGKWVDLCVN